jgi:dTMP kinase
MSKGLFITFEGGEGASKTTQAKLLQQYYIDKGQKVILTREPGGTKFGESIRNPILTNDLEPVTMLLAMMAARNQHICEVIKPALANNWVVICDRFVDSTACYQTDKIGFLSIEKVYALHKDILGNFLPDLTILLNLHPKIALTRARSRTSASSLFDKIEAKGMDYHIEVYEKYLKLAQMFPERVCLLEASGSADEIHQNVVSTVLTKISSS